MHNLKKEYPLKKTQVLYFKAFNCKITPVLLTIISTIAGLIPFTLSGQNEAFWFSFAAGSIGWLNFSLIGILVYLPILTVERQNIWINNVYVLKTRYTYMGRPNVFKFY